MKRLTLSVDFGVVKHDRKGPVFIKFLELVLEPQELNNFNIMLQNGVYEF